ncbi:MAG TPA: c-type cytochrome [Burkholderiales bacterium]
MSEHDEHTSFIKTPQQLIVVILLSFIVPITLIVLTVKLVLDRPHADPGALAPEAVAKRLQPVGRVEFGGAPAAAKGSRSGEEVTKAACVACHETGAANAPKIGDTAAWAPRIKAGLDSLYANAVKGQGAMPPRGGADVTDDELRRSIVYMANLSGASFKAPAAAAAAPAAAAPAAPAAASAAPMAAAPAAKPAAADGKKVYDTACIACHASGVANAPKLGDKAAWAPRLAAGIDGLTKTVITGKGAMPPKAGNAGLADADIRAAVEYMVVQAK